MVPATDRASASRPRFQVESTAKMNPPATSGNQPPSATLTRFAERKERSTARKAKVSGQTTQRDQRHRSRATRWKSSVVMVIVPVTAMP